MSSLCYTIHLLNTRAQQKELACRADESILCVLRRANIPEIPRGCGGGGCGVCKVQIISGSYRARRMSGAHITPGLRAQNIVLACCVRPTSDIELKICGTQ